MKINLNTKNKSGVLTMYNYQSLSELLEDLKIMIDEFSNDGGYFSCWALDDLEFIDSYTLNNFDTSIFKFIPDYSKMISLDTITKPDNKNYFNDMVINQDSGFIYNCSDLVSGLTDVYDELNNVKAV